MAGVRVMLGALRKDLVMIVPTTRKSALETSERAIDGTTETIEGIEIETGTGIETGIVGMTEVVGTTEVVETVVISGETTVTIAGTATTTARTGTVFQSLRGRPILSRYEVRQRREVVIGESAFEVQLPNIMTGRLPVEMTCTSSGGMSGQEIAEISMIEEGRPARDESRGGVEGIRGDC